jgi:hypothetical protein
MVAAMYAQLPDRRRGLQFAALAATCALVAVAYVLWAMLRHNAAARGLDRPAAPGKDAAAMLARATNGEAPQLLFRSQDDGASYGLAALAPPAAPDGPRVATGLRCDRVDFAAGRGLCLGSRRNGLGNQYSLTTFGADLQPRDLTDLRGVGIPSRARVSPDGRYGAFTVFVIGHNYAVGNFSTRTVLLDMTTGAQIAEMEEFTVLRDGTRFQSPDFNFWGVTFAHDSNRFYATLSSGGKTYLLEGDIAARQVRVLRENVECPSLSPDNTHIAFKKLVGSGDRPVWHLTVLDLATMTETTLAETNSVDDQAEWLDNATIAYALPEDTATPGSPTDVWTVSADGSGAPRLLVPRAASPAVVR